MTVGRREEVYDDIQDTYDDQELEALGPLLDEHIDWEKDGDEGDEGNLRQFLVVMVIKKAKANQTS